MLTLRLLAAKYGALPLAVIALVALVYCGLLLRNGANRALFAPLAASAIVLAICIWPAARAAHALSRTLADIATPLAPPAPGVALADAAGANIGRLWLPNGATCEAPIAAPLVLLAPALGQTQNDNARLAARLAQDGFAVLAIDDLGAHARSGPEWLTHPIDLRTEAALEQTRQRSAERTMAGAGRALEAIASAQTCTVFDTARYAIVGYSFGGSVAAELARRDPRVIAIANMDGTVWGQPAHDAPRVPYLALMSDAPLPAPGVRTDDQWERMLNAEDITFAQRAGAGVGSAAIKVRGATHRLFTDSYATRPSPQWLLIPPGRASELTHAYVSAFLLAHHRTSALPYAPRPEPETTILMSGPSTAAAPT